MALSRKGYFKIAKSSEGESSIMRQMWNYYEINMVYIYIYIYIYISVPQCIMGKALVKAI